MPSGRTSRPALQAPDLLATLPACSGRRQNHPCRRHHECKLDDHTKDDADKEPREERSCGRSQTSLYNGTRTHLSLNKDAPISRSAEAAGRILCRPILGGLHHQYCSRLICGRHSLQHRGSLTRNTVSGSQKCKIPCKIPCLQGICVETGAIYTAS